MAIYDIFEGYSKPIISKPVLLLGKKYSHRFDSVELTFHGFAQVNAFVVLEVIKNASE